MARFTRLFPGEKANITSYREAGDAVDKALTEIYKATKKPIQDIVRAAIITHSQKLKEDKVILKQQKRTDSNE